MCWNESRLEKWRRCYSLLSGRGTEGVLATRAELPGRRLKTGRVLVLERVDGDSCWNERVRASAKKDCIGNFFV